MAVATGVGVAVGTGVSVAAGEGAGVGDDVTEGQGVGCARAGVGVATGAGVGTYGHGVSNARGVGVTVPFGAKPSATCAIFGATSCANLVPFVVTLRLALLFGVTMGDTVSVTPVDKSALRCLVAPVNTRTPP